MPPRQGVVDAFLDYPDGPLGAFEVTQLATDDGDSLHLDSLLAQAGFGLPLPGKWWWTIKIGHVRDRPRLLEYLRQDRPLCESVGVTQPQHLPLAEVDDDVSMAGSRGRPCRCGLSKPAGHRWRSDATGDDHPARRDGLKPEIFGHFLAGEDAGPAEWTPPSASGR